MVAASILLTVLYSMAYVHPDYRGSGLSKPMYAAREKFAKQHPRYTRYITYIADGNTPSSSIHTKRGAKLEFSRMHTVPGHAPVQWNYYSAPIEKPRVLPAAALPRVKAFRYVQRTLAFLRSGHTPFPQQRGQIPRRSLLNRVER